MKLGGVRAQTYLQLPLRQQGAGNVYLLVLSSWKVNFAENPIGVVDMFGQYEALNEASFLISCQ